MAPATRNVSTSRTSLATVYGLSLLRQDQTSILLESLFSLVGSAPGIRTSTSSQLACRGAPGDKRATNHSETGTRGAGADSDWYA